MEPLSTTRRAWPLATLTMLLALAGTVLFILNRHTPVEATWGTDAGSRDTLLGWLNLLIIYVLMPTIGAALGLLVLARYPRHPIGWLLLAIALVSGLSSILTEWLVLNYFTLPTPLPLSGWVALFYNQLWIWSYATTLLAVALFPSGYFLSRRWRQVVLLSLFLFAGLMLLGALAETPLSSAFLVPHPVLTATSALHAPTFYSGVLFMPLSVLVVFGALFFRFRQAGSVERQQIKGLLGFVLLMLLSVAGGVFLVFNGPMGKLGELIVTAAGLFPLLGIGIAILRYRLYDIDLVINRALVYGALTASLLAVYFGSVVLLQGLLAPIGGSDSNFAIVLSTLAIAALFNPLRQRIQRFIDRRFYRRRYDAQQVLAAFAASLRQGEMADLDHLTGEVLHVIQETVQPTHVSVWLRDDASRS